MCDNLASFPGSCPHKSLGTRLVTIESADYCILINEWAWLRSRVCLLWLEVDLGSVLESELRQKWRYGVLMACIKAKTSLTVKNIWGFKGFTNLANTELIHVHLCVFSSSLSIPPLLYCTQDGEVYS